MKKTFKQQSHPSDGTIHRIAGIIALGAVIVFMAACVELDSPPPPYTVNYNANDKTATDSYRDQYNMQQKIKPGSSVTLKSRNEVGLYGLSRYGYYFDGWNTKANGTGTNYNAGASYTPAGDITLYARWVLGYRVTFYANGVTGTPAALTGEAGSSITLPSGSDLRYYYRYNNRDYSYTFIGWNTKSDGTGTNYSGGSAYTPTGNGDITLYAQWRR